MKYTYTFCYTRIICRRYISIPTSPTFSRWGDNVPDLCKVGIMSPSCTAVYSMSYNWRCLYVCMCICACVLLLTLILFFVKGSPYSITERRVPELIPVLGSQPAGDVNHKPDCRLPLLSARPAVTPGTPKRAATNFAARSTEAQWV